MTYFMLIELVEQSMSKCLVNNYCHGVRCILACFNVIDLMSYDFVND